VTDEAWREDENWRLVEYSLEHFEQPPEKPTPGAELAQPPNWCSEVHERRIVATWYRARAT
jgi:hypothetical protein